MKIIIFKIPECKNIEICWSVSGVYDTSERTVASIWLYNVHFYLLSVEFHNTKKRLIKEPDVITVDAIAATVGRCISNQLYSVVWKFDWSPFLEVEKKLCLGGATTKLLDAYLNQ